MLHELGLRAGLEWFAEQIESQHGLPVEIHSPHQQLLGEDLANLLFRCVRELLANVVKNAQSDASTVSIQQSGSALQVEVTDNGRGFDMALSMHADKRFVASMFQAGATAYLLKKSAAGELLKAIGEVIKGTSSISEAANQVIARLRF